MYRLLQYKGYRFPGVEGDGIVMPVEVVLMFKHYATTSYLEFKNRR